MKKFLIIGSINAYSWKEIFPLVKFNKMNAGYLFNTTLTFTIPCSGEQKKEGGICWYQTLKKNIDRQQIKLYKHYNTVEYPKYDNYDAINVDMYKDIPVDYYGLIGVPITFLKFMDRQKFELVRCINPIINDKCLYKRLIIRRKV